MKNLTCPRCPDEPLFNTTILDSIFGCPKCGYLYYWDGLPCDLNQLDSTKLLPKESDTIVIGIDPGLKGGVAYWIDGKVVAFPMPTRVLRQVTRHKISSEDGKKHPRLADINGVDGYELAKLIPNHVLTVGNSMKVKVYCELVGALPDQGSTSGFNFGEGCGVIRGVMEAKGFEYSLIRPQEWKKEVLWELKEHDKEAAIWFAREQYPNVPIVLPRCKKAHDGMADAICILHYGLMKEGVVK